MYFFKMSVHIESKKFMFIEGMDQHEEDGTMQKILKVAQFKASRNKGLGNVTVPRSFLLLYSQQIFTNALTLYFSLKIS